MKLDKKLIQLLDLSPEERKIFSVLSNIPKSIATITLDVQIPRTTVVRTLEKLFRRRLASKHRIGIKRGGWILSSPQEIAETIQILGGRKSFAPIKISQEAHEVIVYKGKGQMMILADKVFDFSKGERVYWMQPNKLWEVWTKHGLKKRIVSITHQLKEQGVITEGLFADNFIEYDYKFGGEELLRGYLDRPTIIHTIPESFLQFYSDIMVYRDAVSIMNWKDEVAIEIRNKDLVIFFKSMFEYIKTTGKKVNIQEVAQRKLNEK